MWKVLFLVVVVVVVVVRVLLMLEMLLLLLCVHVLFTTHLSSWIVQVLGMASTCNSCCCCGRVDPPVLPLFLIQDSLLAFVLMVKVTVMRILTKRAAAEAPLPLLLQLDRCQVRL
jgi:hypothetical protein